MLQYIQREDFLSDYFDYKPGQHIAIIGPTNIAGKSYLGHQLLDQAIRNTGLPAVSLVMKPRDRTVSEWSQKLGFKEIRSWPPAKMPWQATPRGYTLWPGQSMTDIGADNEHLASEFKKAILDTYRHGDGIIFADEVYGLCVELGLSTELTALWTRGQGMGAGLWSLTQKPSGTQQGSIPSFVYNSPTWTFLSRDPDKRNRDRFSEIGGVDGHFIGDEVMKLRKYEFLCLHREGPYMAIISP
jgi:hypothetical protein